MKALKRLFRLAVSTPGVIPNMLRGSDAGVIFMLHRFPDPQLSNQSAHDVDVLRVMLGYLRRRRVELLPLAEMFERANAGEPLRGAVAFTIDDGYKDHASVAAPLFAEFDCPVTTFLATGFLDRLIWFWWDHIDFVFRNAKRSSFHIEGLDRNPVVLSWSTRQERDDAQASFTAACKRLPESGKKVAIERLAKLAEVEIPAQAPPEYSPMSWDDARRCESLGMTFGPHTVTHPILARADDAQAEFEIVESWQRVRAELTKPVPVFCYPNGQEGDYGEREMRVIGEANLRGSVIGTPGYATGDDIRSETRRFRIRRFVMPDSTADLVQYVTGVERMKEKLRGRSS